MLVVFLTYMSIHSYADQLLLTHIALEQDSSTYHHAHTWVSHLSFAHTRCHCALPHTPTQLDQQFIKHAMLWWTLCSACIDKCWEAHCLLWVVGDFAPALPGMGEWVCACLTYTIERLYCTALFVLFC